MNPIAETTHNGKIGRLPRDIRDLLNLRLENGERSGPILGWLNALPEVQAALASGFGGKQVNEQNLTNWRQGGYEYWLKQQERRRLVREFIQNAAELAKAADGMDVANEISAVLVADLAASAREALAAITDPAEQCERLQKLLQTVGRVRRQDYLAGRLAIDRELRARDQAKEKQAAEYQQQCQRECEPMRLLFNRASMEDLYAQPDFASQAMAGEEAESLLRDAIPDGSRPSDLPPPADPESK